MKKQTPIKVNCASCRLLSGVHCKGEYSKVVEYYSFEPYAQLLFNSQLVYYNTIVAVVTINKQKHYSHIEDLLSQWIKVQAISILLFHFLFHVGEMYLSCINVCLHWNCYWNLFEWVTIEMLSGDCDLMQLLWLW